MNFTKYPFLVGIDPDTDKCGVVTYDTRTAEFTEHLIPAFRFAAFAERIKERHPAALFVLEMPSTSTAYGASFSKDQRGKFMQIFNSGKGAGVALVLESAIQSYGLQLHIVQSHHRINFEGFGVYSPGKLITPETPDAMVKYHASALAKARKSDLPYPSKWPLKTARRFFPVKSANKEILDAAGLLFPVWYQK